MASRAVFIVAARRTPFGTYGGKLKGITATELCRVAACSALEAGRVPAEAVDSVIVGNVAQVRSQRLLGVSGSNTMISYTARSKASLLIVI